MKDQTHDVSPEDGERLLELLRACAHAPPATEEALDFDHHYKSAEALLKDSNMYKDNPHVKFWLSNTWLNIPQVLLMLHDKLHASTLELRTHFLLMPSMNSCTLHTSY